jgi:hypothetical protein
VITGVAGLIWTSAGGGALGTSAEAGKEALDAAVKGRAGRSSVYPIVGVSAIEAARASEWMRRPRGRVHKRDNDARRAFALVA